MSKLSEEEILNKLRKMLYYTQKANECGLSNNDFKEHIEALEGILDLYNKEKEKNKMLNDAFDRGWIHKDKVRERIRELKIIRDENADEIKRNMRFYSIYDSYNLQINELHDLLLEEE